MMVTLDTFCAPLDIWEAHIYYINGGAIRLSVFLYSFSLIDWIELKDKSSKSFNFGVYLVK